MDNAQKAAVKHCGSHGEAQNMRNMAVGDRRIITHLKST